MSTPSSAEAAPVPFADLSLAGFLQLVLRHWVTVVVAVLIATAGATAVAFWMTPVYRAEVVLSPNEGQASGGALTQIMSRMGSLGSLAGLSLGSGSSVRNESIAMLKSRALTESFIQTRDLMPQLYPDEWSAEQGKWLTDDPPTLAGAVEDFNKDVRFITEDRRTGLVTLRIEWHDPQVAADWANAYVALANESARQRAIEESRRTIKYLNDQLAQITVVAVREAIYSLIESRINTIAVANVQEDFAFRVVDPAIAPELDRFVRPMRPLIIALGVVVGLCVGLLVVLLRRDSVPRPKAVHGA